MSENRIDVVLRARKQGVDEAFRDVHNSLKQHQMVMRDVQLAYRQQHEGLYLAQRLFSGVGAQIRHIQGIYQTYALGMLNAKTQQERVNVALGTLLNLGLQVPSMALSLLELFNVYKMLAAGTSLLTTATTAQAAATTQLTLTQFVQAAATTTQTAADEAHNVVLAKKVGLMTILQALKGPAGWTILAGAAVAGGAAVGYFAAQSQRPSAQTIASEAVLVRRSGTAVVHEGERISRERGIGGGVSVQIGQLVVRPDGLSPGMAARELGWRLRHLRPEAF